MNEILKSRLKSGLILFLLLTALCGSIYEYAVQNRRLVKETIYKTMGEAAQQQLLLFHTKLQDQFSQLEILADSMKTNEPGPALNEDLLEAMNRTAEKYGFFGVGFIAAADGIAHLNTGESFDASERAYFKQALAGETALEYVEHGRLTGVPIVVLAVPVYANEKVVAVLFASHDTAGFAALLTTSAFGGQSYSYITDGNGYIIVAPKHPSALFTQGNVLDFFADAKLERGLTADDIAAHMRAGDAFTFSLSFGRETRYASFMPVGANDWRLFYVTTAAVVAARAASSAHMVYVLAAKLLLIFIVFTIALLLHERRIQRGIALREEEYRVAASQSDKAIMRYDIRKKTSFYAPDHAPKGLVRRMLSEGVPESVVAAGLVAEESVKEYLDFYAAMRRGEHTGTAVCRMKTESGDFGWFRADYTLVGGDTPPHFAIVSFYDVTQQREQEIIYERWRQSLRDRPPESYSLFHCSLGGECSVDTREGALLAVEFDPGTFSFDAHTEQYVAQYVIEEDQERFSAFLKTEALLENCYRGDRVVTLEYREKWGGGYRWIRLSVDLVELGRASDVEAYLLFENIDAVKRSALALLERAEQDPLTGLLNRNTFAQNVNAHIRAKPAAVYALLMLDIDNFKLVNDVFGHGAGDQTLIDIAGLLCHGSRHGDLVGRLGGDEFVVFLSDISDETAAAKKARQVCDLTRKTLSPQVQISSSVGITLYPRDGESFEVLYKKADDALYYVKGRGKDSYAFYQSEMNGKGTI